MQEKSNLEFCFKGNRTYVQGPDIFDTVVNTLNKKFDIGNITNIKYAAHDMLYKNANLYITDNFDKTAFNKINSIITFKENDKKITAVVSENNNTINCSTEYSEEVVKTKSILINNCITFLNESDDSLTEIIVSMNKYFLQQTVPQDGKWIVTKFEYSNLTDLVEIKNKELKLELTNNFNNKLTKSTVIVDALVVGYLYFSLI